VGIPPALLAAGPAAMNDPATRSMLNTLVERAAFVETTNLAWALIATLSLASLALLPFIHVATGPGGRAKG